MSQLTFKRSQFPMDNWDIEIEALVILMKRGELGADSNLCRYFPLPWIYFILKTSMIDK
jgi:hypothetical protein